MKSELLGQHQFVSLRSFGMQIVMLSSFGFASRLGLESVEANLFGQHIYAYQLFLQAFGMHIVMLSSFGFVLQLGLQSVEAKVFAT